MKQNNEKIDALRVLFSLLSLSVGPLLVTRIVDVIKQLKEEAPTNAEDIFEACTEHFVRFALGTGLSVPPAISVTEKFYLQAFWKQTKGNALCIDFLPDGRIRYGLVLKKSSEFPEGRSTHYGTGSEQDITRYFRQNKALLSFITEQWKSKSRRYL